MFTDIEGSARMWEEDPDAMREALGRHDELLRDAIDVHRGVVFATGGDGFAAAFARAGDAVTAAAAVQVRLQAENLPRVRIGIHTGEAQERGGDYFGPALNRAARLMAIGHGGQVLVSQATGQLVTDVELRDLGEHRLRDLSQPERVFQLVIDGVAGDFPPLRSLNTLPTNLPLQLTTFVGRDEELKHITSLVAANRLVTITGVGGVGKTRTALQVAAELLAEHRDGVWMCELANAEDDNALGDVVSVALRAPARPGLSLVDSVVEFLRPRQLVLIVDNCEHLLGPVGALIEGVLRECPEVRILATSREGLGIPGEQLWPLRSLSTPSSSDPFDLVELSDSVKLFVDRARDIDPAFSLTEDDAPAVGEICRRLDGIPLAIELAAARVALMTAPEIAALLDERFRLLTGGRRRAVERHHTLRATVDWSYSLLDQSARDVFDRLAVFAGTFDAAAAQAIATGEGIEPFDVLDALGELVAKSMLSAEHRGGVTRYQVLETLRQYGLEKLESRDETDALRRRHAEYFAAFAERIGPLLLGADELLWRPRLQVELDNLRAAVGWATERAAVGDQELGLRIIASLSREAVLDRGSGIGGWATRAIEATEPSSSWRPTVLVSAAYDAFHHGDLDVADRLAMEAYDTTRDTALWTAAWAQMARANVTAIRGRLTEALSILEDVASWLPEEKVHDRHTLHSYDRHTVHSIIALYTNLTGDHEKALASAQIALKTAQLLGQPSALALALYANGTVLAETDLEKARRHCEQSIEVTDQGASDVVYANAYSTLALLSARAGDVPKALRAARRSIGYAHSIGDRPPMISTLHTAANLLAPITDPERCAVLAGGILDGWCKPMSTIIPERDRLAPNALAELEAVLGTDAFRDARARGASMNFDNLVALILEELDTAISSLDADRRPGLE